MHISRYPLATELVDDDNIFIASKTVGPRRYPIKELVTKVDTIEGALNSLSGSASGGLSNLNSSLTSLRSTVNGLSSSVSTNTSNISGLTSRVNALETSQGSSSDTGTISQATSSTPGIVKLYDSANTTSTDGVLTARYTENQLQQLRDVRPTEIPITVNTNILPFNNNNNILACITIGATGRSKALNAGRVFLSLAGSLRWHNAGDGSKDYYPFNYIALLKTGMMNTSFSSSNFNTYLQSYGHRHRFYGFLSNGVAKFQIETLILAGQVNFRFGADRGFHWWGNSNTFGGVVAAPATEIRFDYNYCRMFI